MRQKSAKAKVIAVRLAGADHAVNTLEGGRGDLHRATPCGGCPWRKENDGMFPAEAFKHSAPTAYDMATNTFACHESGIKAATCAGFILASDHNLSLRLKERNGKLDRSKISDGGCDLHSSYRAMAIANGVPPDDPVLEPCRP